MLHSSIARYLSTQGEKSLFRDNALIDPETNKYAAISLNLSNLTAKFLVTFFFCSFQLYRLMERQRVYVSPYSRAFVGDITVKTKLPDLELETGVESRLSKHRKDIELVNKNVLDVSNNMEAIKYFAKKY